MSGANTIPRDEFFESMLGDFLDESGQLLVRLNENMLQLDEWFRSLDESVAPHCDLDLLNEMFRSAHSLKGLSAMLGLADINHLTHKIENVFDAARKDELPLNCEVVELMFQAIDRLGGLVEALKEPSAESIACDDILDGIHKVLDSAGVEKNASSQADAEKALDQLTAETGAGNAPVDETPADNAAQPDTPMTVPTIEPAAENLVEEDAVAEPADAGLTVADVDYFADIADETDLQSKYTSIFIDETELSLDSLTEVLLALEGDGHREAIEELLITSHRIKGSAASIGLNRAAKMAHLMEDMMQDLFTNGKSLTQKMADALLACIDGLRNYVDSLRRGKPRTEHFNPLAVQLLNSQAVATEVKRSTTESAVAPPVTPPGHVNDELRNRVCENFDKSEWASVLFGVVTFQSHLPLAGLKGRLLYEKMNNIGEIRYFSPDIGKMEEMEDLASLEFGLITNKPIETLKQMLHVGGVSKVEVAPLSQGSDEPVQAVQPEQAVQTVQAAQAVQTATATTAQAATPAPVKTMPQNTSTAKVETSKPIMPAEGQAKEAGTEGGGGKSAKAPVADNSAKPTETLRVDIERLDQLMNLAGQLVINKARFEQIGDKLKKAVSGRQSRNVLNDISTVLSKLLEPKENDDRLDLDIVRSHARRIQADLEEIRRDMDSLATVRTTVNDLFETIHLLDRVSDGIQQSVMDTRMLPIGPLFQRFKRVIRDISKSNGKNIRLEINGEKTELDKRMIDELGDPLIHMVRNSADHGIESPEVRLAAGKPEQGTVTLDAFHRGNSIYIRITDDGKGLDVERIKAKALEKGLISTVEAERMTRQQIFQLIWEPGFSTAEKVTEVSGRGMGMDIVKSKIEVLNGTVELDSETGQGTTVTIKLPLTLAILPSLMVSIDDDIFAMPLESVVEIVSVSSQDIFTIHRKPTARVRGRVISMVDLGSIFSWHRGKKSENADWRTSEIATTLVIINENGRELGLAVDRVIGEQDIVIKSMAENYKNVQGVAGASILGDGRVSLILDIAAMIDMATCHKVEA